jgi:peptide/nickel transport system permease protein
VSRYIAGRAGQLVVVLFLASIAVFYLIRLFPGDPAAALAGSFATPQGVAAAKRQLGLDKPLPVQYGIWLRHTLKGDLGKSYFSSRPVTGLIRQSLPVTLQLTAFAFVTALVVGLPLGIAAALQRYRFWRGALALSTAVWLGIPDFLLALVYLIVFALHLRWFPASGFANVKSHPIQAIRASVLPTLALALPLAVIIANFARQALSRTLDEDYIRTARAKGLAEGRVILSHAMRNSLLALLTLLGIVIARLLGGAIIEEVIFAWPGIGRLSVNALEQRDYIVFQGLVLLFLTTVIVVNFLVDIGYALLDPRIRFRS